MFNVEIHTDNDAFEGDNRNHEVGRILMEIKRQLLDGFTEARIRDLNGNTVGKWSIS